MKRIIILSVLIINFYIFSLYADDVSNKVETLIQKSSYYEALRFLKDKKNYNYYKGICYFNLFKYKKALKYFLNTETDKADINFYIGLCYYKLQNFYDAIYYFQESKAKKYKVDESNFFIGLSNFYIGNYKTAIYFLKKVKGPYQENAKKFIFFSENNSNIRTKNINNLINIIKKDPKNIYDNYIPAKLDDSYNRLIDLYFNLRFGYNSNILEEPYSSTSKDSENSDIFFLSKLTIAKRFFITEEFFFKPEIDLCGLFYQDYSKYDVQKLTPSFSFNFITNKIYFQIKPQYENIEIDKKKYQKNFGIISKIYINDFDDDYLLLKLTIKKKDFFRYNDKDCIAINTKIYQFFKFDKNIFKIGFSLNKQDADSNIYSYTGVGFSEGISTLLFNWLTLKNLLSFQYRDYETSKYEKIIKCLLSLSCKIEYFNVGFNLEFLKNISNYNNSDYDTTRALFFLSFNY